jgi:hypothetical protein
MIADGTKVGSNHQWPIIAHSLPSPGFVHCLDLGSVSEGAQQCPQTTGSAGLRTGIDPCNVPVLPVGDSGFDAVGVMCQLEKWHWDCMLRQEANHQVKLTNSCTWRRLGDLIHKPGQSTWFGAVFLTARNADPVNLLVHWKVGEDKAWLLATNLPSQGDTLRACRHMWIEEMFGDLKRQGFDLESTHLRHFARLSRWSLAAALLYVCLISTGAAAIKNGQRHLVDRKDRRALSIFRTGLRFVERRLTRQLSISIFLCPVYARKRSGG